MSADNFYLVVPHPRGGYSAVMGFASDDEDTPLVPRDDAPRFDTPTEALDSVIDEYAEYGHSISPECYDEPDPDRPNRERARRAVVALVEPVLGPVGDRGLSAVRLDTAAIVVRGDDFAAELRDDIPLVEVVEHLFDLAERVERVEQGAS